VWGKGKGERWGVIGIENKINDPEIFCVPFESK
jgi:hypothetical protein